mmetsp:Transcript_21585/g.33115  ORF Transcript_21585/g.33115 Transcript_21585/m.33115 type:complete len:277 (+) Transcript_21585:135-965(+)
MSTSRKGQARERFFASALAAGIAESLTLPIDVVKVRLQTGFFGHVGQTQLGVFSKIIRTEGAAALWKGIFPALVRQCSYTGLSLVLYEPIRDAIAGKGVKQSELPFWKRVLAGGAAGGTSIFVFNWADVLKARMQNSKMQLPMLKTALEIYKARGILGFWAGSSPNVARCFVGNAAELGAYDQFKMLLVHFGQFSSNATITHLAASTGAGFVSAFCSAPVDVLKTRLQTSAGLTNDTLFSLAVKIPMTEGFFSFYKGFWPLFQRKVIWTVFFFYIL